MLFSSVAVLLGSAGQASYAAANGDLDAAAAASRLAGVPVTSVQWGPWADAGMAAQGSAASARLRRLGFGTLTAQSGLSALQRVLTGHSCGPVQVAASLDWPALLRGRPAGTSAMFSEMAQDAGAPASLHSSRQSSSGHAESLACYAHRDGRVSRSRQTIGKRSTHPQQQARAAEVLAVVLDIAQSLTGVAVKPHESVVGAGLDSLGAFELRNALAERLATALPATLAFNYPTPLAIAEHVAALKWGTLSLTVASDQPGTVQASRTSTDSQFTRERAGTAVLATASRLPQALFKKGISASDVTTAIPFQVSISWPSVRGCNLLCAQCTALLHQDRAACRSSAALHGTCMSPQPADICAEVGC